MNRHGFTLIELAVVLLIVALVAGGIAIGRGMIETAEARTIISERNLYVTAFKQFQDTYLAVPGDMNNAESLWGSDVSCPNTATNTIAKEATCNGDGNGIISNWTNGAPTSQQYEMFRVWQHLANARLIEGRYTGVTGSGSVTDATFGVNVPLSKTGKGGWGLFHTVSDGATDDYYMSAVASHLLTYGAKITNAGGGGAIINPTQAKNIDVKIDDGMPFTGNMRVRKSNATTCTVSATLTSDYLLTTTAATCTLFFLLGL